MTSNYEKYYYGNALGRIQGDGRFNNVNSIIVNSKRIFYKDPGPKETSGTANRTASQLMKPVQLYKPTETNLKQNNYNLYENIGKEFTVKNNVGYAVPASYGSISNKFSVSPMSLMTNSTKSDYIEKMFYDYKKNSTTPLRYSSVGYNNHELNKSLSDLNLDKKFGGTKSSYDFHSIYNKSNYSVNMGLNPNILHTSDVLDPNKAKDIKVETKSPNDYTVSNCSSCKGYTYKQIHNEKYQINFYNRSVGIDQYDSDFSQGLFAIFEGIEGDEVSDYCAKNLPDILARNIRYNPKTVLPFQPANETSPNSSNRKKGIQTSTETILLNTCLKLDDDIKYLHCLNIAATACIALITKEREDYTGFSTLSKVLYVANIGTTQCILVSTTSVKRLTINHVLSNPLERNRINNSGGVIYGDKVYGQTELTRAFGYFSLKPYGITAVPNISKIYLGANDKYIVIGTRGIFDSLSDSDILLLCNSGTTEEIANSIITNTLSRFCRENLSVYVISL